MSDTKRKLPASRGTSVPSLGPEQSLNRYLAEIRKFPVLTAEQEYMLAKRYSDSWPRSPWVTAAMACPCPS
jgi:RNA polymerase sigma-32 factor